MVKISVDGNRAKETSLSVCIIKSKPASNFKNQNELVLEK